LLLLLPLLAGAAQAQLRGHGGPVRSLAISPDGKTALSGSFDSSAIRWSLERNVAEQVMRFHDSAVNAVAILPDGRLVTGGEDGKIAVWQPAHNEPIQVFNGHTGPVVSLAVSPDGKLVASASWDRTVRVWPVDGGPALLLEGHRENVTAVAFMPDGKAVVSVSHDPEIRIWPLGSSDVTIVKADAPLNSLAVAPDGEIIAGGADGKLYFYSPTGEARGEAEAATTPVISLAVSPDGKLVAAASIRGSVAILDRATRKLARTLVGPGLPVWSVAFFPDSRTLLTGGADRMIRRWDTISGEPADAIVSGAPNDPLAAYNGDPGAQVFRACVACHTLSPDEGNKAGPSLAGIFGRKIGSLPGYRYSNALQHMDIVWTPATVSKMFEVGPMTFTPGTKMPEQTIGSPEDRQALVDFLAKATISGHSGTAR
jgi:cytochrome c